MKIAIEGCAHGELDKIYETLQYLEKEEGFKVDLLICCGDFQATRNSKDLSCMAVSQKFRNMCSFYKYYSGERIAPVLTLFIGGNHEASNYLQELGYGGWAAPNIYYLGYAGVVSIGGIRIAGLSGIYKGRDYMRGHYEIVPYSEESKRSVYHIRNLEVFRLKQLSQPIDIMLSHDWPRGITDYGDVKQLLEIKPFFRSDIEENKLGSKPAQELLNDLQPSYWFAAHLHCKFAALVPHGPRKGVTKFLSLDKCLPKRKFLQIMEFEHDESEPLELSYDLEWLTIVHLTNHLLSVKKGLTYMPAHSSQERWIFTPTEEEKNFVLGRFDGDLKVPLNFTRTVTPYSPDSPDYGQNRLTAQLNPQTTTLCEKLGVDDPLALLLAGTSQGTTPNSKSLPDFLTPDQSRDLSQGSDLNLTDLSCHTNSSTSVKSVKRLSMSLPPPKLVLPERNSEEYLSLSTEQSQENNTSQQTSQDSASTEPLVSESTSSSSLVEGSEPLIPVKKFKRRNQALYTDVDSD